MTDPAASPKPARSARLLLSLAAVAVMFAAADTYVVVLSLPDMMGSVGLSVEQLQRAAPIVSGFLLGYVAMLPLIGRVADLRGRPSVLVAALLVFAFGSLVTASAYDLGSLVTGRFLQGVGGGGLVPVTLALVADLYPADRRGVPLGVVGAVQELGSVIGPLYGAVVISLGGWRDIFWINLAVALVLAAAIVTLRRVPRRFAERRPGLSGRAATVSKGPPPRLGRPAPARPQPDRHGAGDAAAGQPGHVGVAGRAVRAVPRRRLGLVLPARGGHRRARAAPAGAAAHRALVRWWTCATGGARCARPTWWARCSSPSPWPA